MMGGNDRKYKIRGEEEDRRHKVHRFRSTDSLDDSIWIDVGDGLGAQNQETAYR